MTANATTAMPVQLESALIEAEALIAHLQAVVEMDKTQLARELHDELGGSMVSAAMDLSTVARRLPSSDPAQMQLCRAKKALETAIDLSRRVIEELRPTILDNFGLFAAIRWQFDKFSRGSAAICTQSYPSTELKFEPSAATGLFRIAQESLAMTLGHSSFKAVDLDMRVEHGGIDMTISSEGTATMAGREQAAGATLASATALASIRHRVRILGGTFRIIGSFDGDTVLQVWVPLDTAA